jgi:hypothetical protein
MNDLIAALKKQMNREAQMSGPVVVGSFGGAYAVPNDAEPNRNTRETFATLGVELGLREESKAA